MTTRLAMAQLTMLLPNKVTLVPVTREGFLLNLMSNVKKAKIQEGSRTVLAGTQ